MKYVLAGLGLLFSCSILIISIFPYLLTSAQIEKYVNSKLTSLLQTKTSLQNIRLSLWPPISVTVEGLVIKEKGVSQENLMLAEELMLKVSPLSLLRRELSLEEIRIRGLRLNIKRNRQGETNLSRFLMLNANSNSKGWYIPYSPQIKYLIIEQGKILVRDETPANTPFTFTLRDIRLSIRRASLDHSFPFHLEGLLEDRTKPAKIAFKGKLIPPNNYQNWSAYRIDSNIQIESFPLAQLTPILSSKKLAGRTDIKGNYYGEVAGPFSSSFRLKFFFLGLNDPRLLQQPIDWPEGALSFKLDYSEKGLSFRNILLRVAGYSLKGFCHLKGQQVHAHFNSESPLPLNSIKDYMPPKIVPKPIYKYIQKRMLRGLIDNFSLEIKGRLKEIINKELIAKKDVIMAQARLSKVELTFHDHFQSVEEVTGLVKFRKGKLIFSNLRGRYKNSGVLKGFGQINDLLGIPILNLSIKGPIKVEDLGVDFASNKSAPPFLYILGREGNFIGPAWLDLNISRVLKNKRPPVLTGKLELRNNRISYAPLKLPLTQLQGIVEFTRETIQTRNLTGRWGQSAFLVRGTMGEYRHRNPSLHLRISGQLDISQMKKHFSDNFLNNFAFQGPSSLEVNIENRADQWQIAGNLDLTNTAYQYNGIRKNRSVPNLLTFDLQRGPEQSWKIGKLEIALKDIGITVEGKVTSKNKGNSYWEIAFQTNKFDINQMLSLLEDTQPKGQDWVQGMLSIEGTWQTSSPPKIKFNLAANQIDLNQLFSKSGNKNGEFLRNNLLQGSITSKRGRILGLSFSQLKADVLSSKIGVIAGDLDLKIYQGDFKGKTSIQLDSPPVSGYYLAGSGRNIKVEKLFQELNHAASELTGTLNLVLELKIWDGATENGIDPLQGKVSIEIADGVLRRYSLVSKVFSFLNISQILEFQLPDLLTKGMPYKKISGDFQIKNGIARTDNLVLTSHSFNMAAVGQIDIPKKSVDLNIAVQPLQTVDKVVALVPILGHILTDENNSLILAVFKAKGPWNDPSVTSIPFASVRKGLLGIFKRVFLLPREVIKEPWEVLLPKLP